MTLENSTLLNRRDVFGHHTVFESNQMPFLCKIDDILNLGPPAVFEMFMILIFLLFLGELGVIFCIKSLIFSHWGKPASIAPPPPPSWCTSLLHNLF